MHDPLAMASFLDHTLLKWKNYYVDVETEGELTAGETVAYSAAPIRGSAPSLREPKAPKRSGIPSCRTQRLRWMWTRRDSSIS